MDPPCHAYAHTAILLKVNLPCGTEIANVMGADITLRPQAISIRGTDYIIRILFLNEEGFHLPVPSK